MFNDIPNLVIFPARCEHPFMRVQTDSLTIVELKQSIALEHLFSTLGFSEACAGKSYIFLVTTNI